MAVRFTPGAVLRLSLADHQTAYALMLSVEPYFAFYRGGEDTPVEEALRNDPVFIVMVGKSAYSRGGWGPVIHRVPKDELPALPLVFRQNPVNPNLCFLVDPAGNATRVAPAEVVGYERETAWSAVHLESRLNDLFAGRPNAAEIAMRPNLGSGE